jgi:thiosulfate/3-mercaptopyruvate sulfurtransferase
LLSTAAESAFLDEAQQSSDNCLSCHADQGMMQAMAVERDLQSKLDTGAGCSVRLAPVDAWQKFYVGDEEFPSSLHNIEGCLGCHGATGEEETGVEMAHEGVLSDPTHDPERVCGSCHSTEVDMAATGLHQNLTGYRTVLEQRGADFDDPGMQQAFDQHCATCHASCGQCHVSRPDFTGGGLLDGHEIEEFAPVKEVCMACHGSRVADEFMGRNEGVEGSVHWLEGSMTCYECHEITEFHGQGADAQSAHRYDDQTSPQCIDCHLEADPAHSDILEHELHWNVVSCSVCHVSGPYKNCYNCHVGTDAEGLPYATSDEEKLEFKIGLNPLQSEERPWEYVLLRHIPVEPDTFQFYGDALLSDFVNVSTWKYTTPHNIQRITPQNETCNNCHGQEELFLTSDDVRPGRWETNAAVIVEQVPPETELGQEQAASQPVHDCLQDPSETATHVVPDDCQPELCLQCHPGTFEGDWTLLDENIHTLYSLVEPHGETIVCQDCHSPEGNFDWAAEGYSAEDAARLTWNQFPGIETFRQPSSGPTWMIGLGLVIVLVVSTPFVLQRNGKAGDKNES